MSDLWQVGRVGPAKVWRLRMKNGDFIKKRTKIYVSAFIDVGLSAVACPGLFTLYTGHEVQPFI